ncbi:hypothetical protein AJ85_06095 [Alkalihalobacillus alcalophilus ATCC 27647 = CGMCC 1.3604]|uniref:Nucleotidyltransferase-like domain-containing protein n=1 Tax=Alkalihalobacillus alcalophilus ATCC 27647 = CGMCC 1.3604 TaxID=1218173 RepID=A0A094WLD5_ALKAL|nr:nucleotidyltransferase-like protein [Alkalihalobacillus alcalophilus]KGA97676.1 hypothetical protein BALCAV_0208540 [Alkalihalobacillus alcalophilus ATCC 27647 = CGMCC 1.3604]MED1562549.1 nucleotidyltransferase-like protein [Alkalihalobacillus alcalophilus]THG91294.1 hypothetical protein AJ85_06095 [Alkalihalobacillus alcalophilus ATCC 27647 = CGMCC 1.3604]
MVDTMLRQLYQDRASELDTCAILLLENEGEKTSITDGFNAVVLIIKEDTAIQWDIKHYVIDNRTVALHILDKELMHYSLIVGSNRRLVDWLVSGKIVYDRNEFLANVKERIETFPLDDRAKKMTIQFTKMLRRFEEGKTLFAQGHFFDAYSNMMHALHHLARLAVIRQGFYPEITVWEQVRQIEPETYKLYQELLKSEETLEKRIELMVLATEFAIHSKTIEGSQHFIDCIRLEKREWSISELMALSEVEDYKIDLELFLNFLVEKKIMRVECKPTKANGINHLRYHINFS